MTTTHFENYAYKTVRNSPDDTAHMMFSSPSLYHQKNLVVKKQEQQNIIPKGFELHTYTFFTLIIFFSISALVFTIAMTYRSAFSN